ncbi:MAG: biopolymer transporter ExbD [Verrucomicrobiota bacterium]
MIRLKKKMPDRAVFPIAPMIDCVFLLMVYFMLATTWNDQERDLAFELPGIVEQSEPLHMPDEQTIELTAGGQALVNGYAYDSPTDERYAQLKTVLTRLKQSNDANKTAAQITIAPAEGTAHQAIVKVMDAAQNAGIETINFSLDSDTIIDVVRD